MTIIDTAPARWHLTLVRARGAHSRVDDGGGSERRGLVVQPPSMIRIDLMLVPGGVLPPFTPGVRGGCYRHSAACSIALII